MQNKKENDKEDDNNGEKVTSIRDRERQRMKNRVTNRDFCNMIACGLCLL